MAYVINKTNGATFATVSDGTVNTSSSIAIVGRNYAGYGEFLGENFIKILENSANTSAPGNPLEGQLWYDSGNTLLSVYNGSEFKPISSVNVGASAPTTSLVMGDLWFDSSANKTLHVYDGSAFKLVGPELPAGTTSNDFLRSDTNDTTSGTLGVLNDSGLAIGLGSDCSISVSGSDVSIKNITSNGDLILSVNDGGVQTSVITIDGASGKALVNSSPTASLGIATKAYVDSQTSGAGTAAVARDGSNTITGVITPDINNTKDFGSAALKFQTIYATTFSGNASTANYADLAERFEADEVMEAGTVVELGGVNEITQAIDELTDNVFGVISTNAAYLMNAGAGASDTHPPVAMNGRVPVKVIGQVSKGDRLVSAGNGFARAATQGEITAFNVIGRSLENKTTNGTGTVEAIVKVN